MTAEARRASFRIVERPKPLAPPTLPEAVEKAVCALIVYAFVCGGCFLLGWIARGGQ